MKNWNDGKAQEYRDRAVYDVEHSHMDSAVREAAGCRCAHVDDTGSGGAGQDASNVSAPSSSLMPGSYLITTETCPNCKRVKPMLDAAGVKYIELLASQNEELVGKLGIMTAPTLLEVGEDGSRQLYVGAPAIMLMLAVGRA